MSTAKVFSESSSADKELRPKKSVRELIGSFEEFLAKAYSEIHYEVYTDYATLEHVLSITALAKDGHILKHELRIDTIDGDKDDLLKKVPTLEVENNIVMTPGKWY